MLKSAEASILDKRNSSVSAVEWLCLLLVLILHKWRGLTYSRARTEKGKREMKLEAN